MTKDDVMLMLGKFRAAWPNYYKGLSDADVDLTIEIWHEQLVTFDPVVVDTAVKRMYGTRTFPPVICEVLEEIAKIIHPEVYELSPEEAWGEVKLAFRKAGIYSEEKAYSFMSPITIDAVKAMGWRELCMSENEPADRAHFFKIYGAMATRKRETAKIPSNIALEISTLTQKLSLEAAAKKPALPEPAKPSIEEKQEEEDPGVIAAQMEFIRESLKTFGTEKKEVGAYQPLSEEEFEKRREKAMNQLREMERAKTLAEQITKNFQKKESLAQ